MFVSQSKYDAMRRAFEAQFAQKEELLQINQRLQYELRDELERNNSLTRRVIELVAGAARATTISAKQFDNDDIKTLIRLCHPDKHGNSESATAITAKLLKMRK
jgi:hypothetical protein